MATEFTEFLELLTQFTDNSTYDVFLPHSQKNLKLKQINAEQFNKLLATYAVETKKSYIDFNKAFFSIIHENLIQKDIDIKTLSVFDINILTLKTRQVNISDMYTFYYTPEEIEEHGLQNTKVEISLKEHLDVTCKNILPKPPLTVNSGDITLLCDIPTLYSDILLENYFVENVETDTTEKFIESYFLKEITKHIQEVTLTGKMLNISNLPVEEKIQLVKKLPSTVINEAIKCIEKLRQPLTELVTVNIIENINGNEVVLTKEIPLDSSLFNF